MTCQNSVRHARMLWTAASASTSGMRRDTDGERTRKELEPRALFPKRSRRRRKRKVEGVAVKIDSAGCRHHDVVVETLTPILRNNSSLAPTCVIIPVLCCSAALLLCCCAAAGCVANAVCRKSARSEASSEILRLNNLTMWGPTPAYLRYLTREMPPSIPSLGIHV